MPIAPTFVGLSPAPRRLVPPAAQPDAAAVLVGGDDGGRWPPVPVAVVGAAEPLQPGRVLPRDGISLQETPQRARTESCSRFHFQWCTKWVARRELESSLIKPTFNGRCRISM